MGAMLFTLMLTEGLKEHKRMGWYGEMFCGRAWQLSNKIMGGQW